MGSCWQPEPWAGQSMSTRPGAGGRPAQRVVAEGAGAAGLKEAVRPLGRSPSAGGWSHPCSPLPATAWARTGRRALTRSMAVWLGVKGGASGGHGAVQMGTRSCGAEPKQGVSDRSLQHLTSSPPLHLSSCRWGLSRAQPPSSTSTSGTRQVCQQWDLGGVRSRS